ncbi:thiolase C-terminal domain-containing protein [Mycolicibacterium sp. ELW1]|uniref:thiolase C-terminal domain-containing protein n=1 Tax=Mycobacteriaceae TaxID=1762 RepID=UPI0025704AB7|nr:transporter [Mycobacterium sp. ELW1]
MPGEIDGFATYHHDKHNGTLLMNELGTRELRWSSMVAGGGGGGIPAAIGMASAAIISGQAEIVVVYRTIAEREFGRFNTGVEQEHADPHYLAHGVSVAAQMVGLRSKLMLEKYAIPAEAVEALVLADYFHARNNPRARAYGNELDPTTYRASRMIVDPYRLYDCSRESDGAAAVIVMSAEAARARSRQPVYLLGIAQGAPFRGGDAVENFGEYSLSGFSSVAARLWQQTGLSATDVDVVQVYENFSPAGVGALMEHGFFDAENVAEVMTLSNLTSPQGKLPVNTSGGCLAEGFIHGMEVVLEGVRQIRGDSPNPVPDAQVCLITGGPASTYVSSALLGTQATL